MHIPVLENKVLEFLQPEPEKIFIDCTVGAGGHAAAILEKLHGRGALFGLDSDSGNLEIARQALSRFNNVHLIHRNFENFEEIGGEILGQKGHIDGILFDLGLSSLHVDEASRGFSFQKDGPLDMRFDTRQKLTAADIVNTYSQEQLSLILKTYGEENSADIISKKIVFYRRHRKFSRTSELKDLIAAIYSKGRKDFYFRRHPATRTFQALRIATNREIEVLQKGLTGALSVLSKQGRIVVISYHSLEDRLVKNLLRESARAGELKILTKHVVRPDRSEILRNRRSRSAKLRAAEKL